MESQSLYIIWGNTGIKKTQKNKRKQRTASFSQKKKDDLQKYLLQSDYATHKTLLHPFWHV